MSGKDSKIDSVVTGAACGYVGKKLAEKIEESLKLPSSYIEKVQRGRLNQEIER